MTTDPWDRASQEEYLPGAMPWLHQYIRGPVLAGLLNVMFGHGVQTRTLGSARLYQGRVRAENVARRDWHGVCPADGYQCRTGKAESPLRFDHVLSARR